MTLLRLAPLVLLSASALASPLQDERPDAEALVEQGWRFVPAYEGAQREALPAAIASEVEAGAHLFAAATALEPEHLRAHWSLGHAHVLLAENAKARGAAGEAWTHFEAADRALSSAIELDATDPWSFYARGAARAGFGRLGSAYDDLVEATDRAARLAQETGPDGSEAWLRFKALEWRPEVLMRAGEFERARVELRAFHDEFSSNAFPLEIALAESYLRERDFVGAAAAYERITQQFPEDHQAHALLAYLAGLQNRRDLATERLQQALALEQAPGLYTRLWLFVLATDEARALAEEDLRTFLEYPPSSVGDWDVRLGRFVLGEGSPDEFIANARAELERRMESFEPLDDLLCECWFYVGHRHEGLARAAGDDATRRRHLEAALASHRRALEFRPQRWKWEWAYARLAFARIASELGRAGASPFERVDDRLQYAGDSYTLVEARWHVPGSVRSTAELERTPAPGDLLLARVRTSDGEPSRLRLVVDVRDD